MRLTCPNCDAQYEVPKDVIPQDGRDVQCSNCGKTWFQHHPDHAPVEPEASEIDPTPLPTEDANEEEERVAIPEPQRQELDPQVSDILREEASRETQARAGGLETQPELGLNDSDDDAAKRAREARDRMARMRGEDPEPAAMSAAVGSRRDLLPDIEEINSTLRSTGDRQISGEDVAAAADPTQRKRRGGFKRGFLTIVTLAVICAAVYILAPMIVKSVPAAEPALSAYTGMIDQARVWLDVKVQGLAQWLDATAAQSGG